MSAISESLSNLSTRLAFTRAVPSRRGWLAVNDTPQNVNAFPAVSVAARAAAPVYTPGSVHNVHALFTPPETENGSIPAFQGYCERVNGVNGTYIGTVAKHTTCRGIGLTVPTVPNRSRRSLGTVPLPFPPLRGER